MNAEQQTLTETFGVISMNNEQTPQQFIKITCGATHTWYANEKGLVCPLQRVQDSASYFIVNSNDRERVAKCDAILCASDGGSLKEQTAIDATLEARGDRYGKFDGHAEITQAIKHAMIYSETSKWHQLSDDKKETLEMIAHKIGRILNGDPDYIDNWHDIQGYAKLVEDILQKEQSNDDK